MQLNLDKNKKLLVYGIVIIPYLVILFLIFKFNEESKIQNEQSKKEIETLRSESEKFKKEATSLKTKNETLKKEIQQEKSKIKNFSKETDTKVITEKFDSKSGKLIERVQKTKTEASKEKIEVKQNETKKEEIQVNKSEAKKEIIENKKDTQEIKKEKEEQVKDFERKRYGVNVGVLSTLEGIGPSISYSVLPITNNVSIDLAGGYVEKPLLGIQASAVFVDSVGVGVGVYGSLETMHSGLQVVPGVSIQYRF
jgi:DNA polymerase III alpha subunit (gram-positive type)